MSGAPFKLVSLSQLLQSKLPYTFVGAPCNVVIVLLYRQLKLPIRFLIRGSCFNGKLTIISPLMSIVPSVLFVISHVENTVSVLVEFICIKFFTCAICAGKKQ